MLLVIYVYVKDIKPAAVHDAAGHIGFIGRAGVFVFVAVLFFRLISNASVNSSDATTIGNGLAQLQKNHGGRACLFILGFFLIVYGLFAVSILLLVRAQHFQEILSLHTACLLV